MCEGVKRERESLRVCRYKFNSRADTQPELNLLLCLPVCLEFSLHSLLLAFSLHVLGPQRPTHIEREKKRRNEARDRPCAKSARACSLSLSVSDYERACLCFRSSLSRSMVANPCACARAVSVSPSLLCTPDSTTKNNCQQDQQKKYK